MQASSSSVSSYGWRQRLTVWLESSLFANSITALILLNAIILGVETSAVAQERAGQWLSLVNQVILVAFTAEIALKLVAFGPRLNGANPGRLSMCARSLVSSAVYSGLMTMPSGVCHTNSSAVRPLVSFLTNDCQSVIAGPFLSVIALSTFLARCL